VKAVVVGGGIAGLAAARRLEALAPDAQVILLERQHVLGGKLLTERVDGFLVEAAPDSFLARKKRGVGLCEELGLGDELIVRKPENRRSFVRRGGELIPLPEGLTGMIPANLEALDSSDLLSAEGKARFASEPDVPPAAGDQDESIASFVTRRFGREAYESLMEPLVTGIYGGDGERLSLAATFPQLSALERADGSVLWGLSARPRPTEESPFLSLRSGMGALVTALVASLRRARLETGREAKRLRRGSSGFEVELADGETIAADGVVVATPAYVTDELLADLDARLAEAHAQIPYGSSVVVTLAFAAEVARSLEGYGYVVPRVEGTDVLACTWSSRKWDGRAPRGASLVRVYVGRFGGRDLTRATDDDLIGLARDELGLVAVDAVPTLTRVHRWPLAMPQYVLGHLDRLALVDEALLQLPGLALAGAAYRGVGIPDCIASGEAAAESVVRALAATPA
jgi:protoporphyrinogen/coproporphyrinogen III oxidase